MIYVERFEPAKRDQWDSFLDQAKNATFLFKRNYMDYHSDRFSDYSLMIHGDDGLMCVLPANLTAENVLISHEGLTYGGFIFRRDIGLLDAIAAASEALKFLAAQGISTIKYKLFPRFYNTLPADEADYILFLLDAGLYRRETAIVVSLEDRVPYNHDRRKNIKKGEKFGMVIKEETDLSLFWNQILSPALMANFGVKPVHSLEEITLLKSRFPNEIRQFSIFHQDEIVGGVTIYETPSVAHAQYTAASESGRKKSALNCLFDWLITTHYKSRRHFDFGTCNEREGRRLNKGLLAWKEGFGGRCYSHDFYLINTENYRKLDEALATV